MTQSDLHVSDEMLNAMLDGELDGAEYKALRERLARDPELGRRAKELLRLKQLIYMARPETRSFASVTEAPRRRISFGARAAVVVLLVTGVAVGMWQFYVDRTGLTQPMAQRLEALRAELAQVPASRVHKVILHTRRGDAESMYALLDQLESLVVYAQRSRKALQVEVVADGPGLRLYRADSSPVIERIREMKARHPNIVFVACNRTRSRIERESGRPVPLLPEAQIVPSVQEQIAQRTRQGWSYIAV